MNEKSDFKNYLKEVPNFLAMFLSMVYILLPSVLLLDISNTTGIIVKDLNKIFVFFLIGDTFGLLTSELLGRKFNRLRIIAISYISIIVLLVFFLNFPGRLYMFCAIFLIIGFLAGVIFIQANKSFFDNKIENKERLVNIAFGFQALGAITAPFLASAVVNHGLGWEFAFYILIFIIVITVISYLTVSRTRAKKDVELIEQKSSINLREIFNDKKKNSFFILTIAAIISYFISETVLLTWSPTFFRIERTFNIQSAGIIIAIFWAAVGVGRVITSILPVKIHRAYIMIALSIIAIVSMNLAFLLNSRYIIFIAYFFIGLGCSGIPTLLFSSGGILYKKGSGLITTVIFTAGVIGMLTAPLLVGYTLESNHLFSIFLSVVFMGITLIFLIIRLFYEKKFLVGKDRD